MGTADFHCATLRLLYDKLNEIGMNIDVGAGGGVSGGGG